MKKKFNIEKEFILLKTEEKRKECEYDGKHKNRWGRIIECRCDECDYLIECTEDALE